MSTTPAPAADRYPQLNQPRFVCPNCGAFAQQDWVGLGYADQHSMWCPLKAVQHEELYKSRWRAAECGSCCQWSIWFDEQMVYPHHHLGAPPHQDMPADVRALYQEAAAVAAVSRRAGAALARATIELLLRVIDPDAPDDARLNKRIERIQGRVSTSLAQLLDVLRFTGNKMLHVEDQPAELVVMALDDEEGPQLVEYLLEATNDLVDELITRPRRANELWDRLPQGVKTSITSARSPTTAGGSGD